VFSDVWITIGGSRYNAVAQRLGKAVRECRTENRSTPTIIRFANLRDIENSDEIRQQSHNISSADQQVR